MPKLILDNISNYFNVGFNSLWLKNNCTEEADHLWNSNTDLHCLLTGCHPDIRYHNASSEVLLVLNEWLQMSPVRFIMAHVLKSANDEQQQCSNIGSTDATENNRHYWTFFIFHSILLMLLLLRTRDKIFFYLKQASYIFYAM